MSPRANDRSAATDVLHDALLYTDDAVLAERASTFVRDGLERQEAVLVVMPPRTCAVVREALGADSAAVEFADITKVARNPARLIPYWRDAVDAHGAVGRRVRSLAEPVWPGRSAAAVDECIVSETLVRLAFADTTAAPHLLCAYDASMLPADVVDLVRQAHTDPSAVELPLPPPPALHMEMRFDATELRHVRRVVNAYALDSGMAPQRVDDLLLAVSEVVTNSVMHGGGAGTLRLWSANRSVVCEVSDSGELTDPLVGRRRPPPRVQLGGRGLWLSNAVCDLVQIRRGAGGTVVRVHVGRGPT